MKSSPFPEKTIDKGLTRVGSNPSLNKEVTQIISALEVKLDDSVKRRQQAKMRI